MKSVFRKGAADARIFRVASEGWDDATIIMEALFDIRSDTTYIIDLLLEEDDGQEEADDS